MFRLSLENFKTWKSKTIYLQIQNGIVLISGESGKGKTSILQSIDFVITGKGKKIIRRGERSCMVYLNFRGIDITRTKGPNRLKVTVDDLTLEDADAQIEINKIFGVDFSMTSFIRQKSYKSFLNLTPKEKTVVIRQNCLSELNNIKENCDNEIRMTKVSIRECSIVVDQLHKVLDEVDAPLDEDELGDIGDNIRHKSENYLNKLLGSIIIKRKNRETRAIKFAENMLSTKDEKLGHEHRVKNNIFFIEAVRKVEEEIEALGPKPLSQFDLDASYTLDTLKYELDMHKKRKDYQTQLESYNNMRNDDIIYRKTRAEDIKMRIDKLIPELEEVENSDISETAVEDAKGQWLKAKKWSEWCTRECKEFYNLSIAECLSPYEKENETTFRKKTKYMCLKGAKKCPSCAATIVFDESGELTKGQYDLKDTDKEEIITKKINIADKIIKKNQKKIREISTTYTRCIKSVAEYENCYRKGKQTLDKRNDIRMKIATEKRSLTECVKENPAILRQEKKLARVKSGLMDPTLGEDDIQERIEKIKQYNQTLSRYSKGMERLQSQLKNIKDQIEEGSTEEVVRECHEKIEQIEENMNKNENERLYYANEETAVKIYLEYISKKRLYEKITSDLAEAQEKFKTENRKYSCLLRLSKVITKAESITMSNYIGTLNVYLDEYIGSFFPTTPLRVMISPFKTDSKSCVKHQITVVVYHSGEEVDVGSLSGGEYDRVQLAITMAMSRVSNSPMMMLDESISSLDETTCNSVLKGIKSNTELSKLVFIVAHQFIEGNFDAIIKI